MATLSMGMVGASTGSTPMWPASVLRFESLQSRRLFSVLFEATEGDDAITLSVVGTQLLITLNDVEGIYDVGQIDTLIIAAGAGNDTVQLDSVGTLPVSVDGGDGDDRLIAGGGNWRAGILADVTLRGGLGLDTVSIDDSAALAADVSITNPFNIDTQFATSSAGTIFVDAGTPDSAVEKIDLHTGNDADRINLLGLSSFTSLNILSGVGDDSILVGDDFDSRINGNVIVDGGTGTNTLTFDDSADAFGDTYFFKGSNATGTLGKNSATALLTYRSFTTLHVLAGIGGSIPNNQSFRVDYLPANTAITIDAGSGDDALTIGNTTLDLGFIQSAITFNGERGFDRVDVIDAIGTDPSTYSIDGNLLAITNQQPIVYTDINFLTVLGNAASNLFDVVHTIAPLNVTLNGGEGDDSFNIGAGDLDSTIGNSVSVIGGAGVDRLVFDDRFDDPGNDTYIFNAGLLNRAVRGFLWSTALADATEYVELLGSENDDTIRIDAASPTISLRIDAGSGNDAINVVQTTFETQPATPIFLTSGEGSDSLTVGQNGSGIGAVVAFDSAVETLTQLVINSGGLVRVVPGADRVLKIDASLTIAGRLDLNDQTLIAANGDFATIEQQAGLGYNGGAWSVASGPAIVSGTAAGSALMDSLAVVRAEVIGLPIYSGVATSTGDVIVRYTLAGDADLDRIVDFDDLLILAQSFDLTVGGKSWTDGNFTYLTADDVPGAVGFDDLLLVAQNTPIARKVASHR